MPNIQIELSKTLKWDLVVAPWPVGAWRTLFIFISISQRNMTKEGKKEESQNKKQKTNQNSLHVWNANNNTTIISTSPNSFPQKPQSLIVIQPHVKRLQPTSHSLTPFLRMELLKFCEECSFWELEKLQLNTTETKKKRRENRHKTRSKNWNQLAIQVYIKKKHNTICVKNKCGGSYEFATHFA